MNDTHSSLDALHVQKPPTRLECVLVPGRSARVHGTFVQGSTLEAVVPAYYGPFARPILWLMALSTAQREELGGLMAAARDAAGMDRASSWLRRHGFPDWMAGWAYEYRPWEWRLWPRYDHRVVAIDRTYRVGDAARSWRMDSPCWPIVRITRDCVVLETTGPRGGKSFSRMEPWRFAEANHEPLPEEPLTPGETP